MSEQMFGPDSSNGYSIRHESEAWGFESPSGRDMFCLINECCFPRTINISNTLLQKLFEDASTWLCNLISTEFCTKYKDKMLVTISSHSIMISVGILRFLKSPFYFNFKHNIPLISTQIPGKNIVSLYLCLIFVPLSLYQKNMLCYSWYRLWFILVGEYSWRVRFILNSYTKYLSVCVTYVCSLYSNKIVPRELYFRNFVLTYLFINVLEAGIIFCMRPVKERLRYIWTWSLIRWEHTQNDLWNLSDVTDITST